MTTGDAVYVQLPAEVSQLTGGKPWAKVNRSALERLAQTVLGPGAPTATPADVLDYVRAVPGDVTAVGPTPPEAGPPPTSAPRSIRPRWRPR